MENEVVIGWAPAKKRRSNRFSKRVMSFLVEQFLISEETGRKVISVETATRIRSLRDDTGNRKFGKGEWLTPQQFTSYFSRQAATKKIGHLPAAIATLSQKKMLKQWWSGLRDTISTKELTNLPRCKFLCIFHYSVLVSYMNTALDKSLCRCLHC